MSVGLSHTPAPRAGGQALRRTSTSQQLHELLRARILKLDLIPGAALSRVELAEQYGVSQTPVREALQKLEQEGLVFVYPQSRTEVTRIDLEQARETQFLRMSLELEITRQLAVSEERGFVPVARRLLRRQREALEIDADFEQFASLDRQFHETFFAAAGMLNLWGVVQERSGHLDRLRTLNLPNPGKAATILSAHHEILDAVAAGDVPAAQAAVRAHLSGTLASAGAIRDAHPAYF